MAGGIEQLHESVDVVGRAASEVTPGLLGALASDGGLQVAQVGSGSIQCVRARRPTWATVVGLIGLPFLGLGVLFFFVRRTDRCTITVVDGPRGAVVTLSGFLDDQALVRARAALGSGASGASRSPASTPVQGAVAVQPGAGAGVLAAPCPPPPPAHVPPPALPPAASISWSPPAPPPVGAAAVAAAADLERTVARTVVAPKSAAGPRLRFDHGAVTDVVSSILIGRDPAATAGAPLGAALLAVPDPTMSVSKTHLLLRVHDGRLWVEDLHSTNGTAILHPGGERVAALPGSPVVAPPGAVVEFGDCRAEVLVDA